jgi:hypothetical protein
MFKKEKIHKSAKLLAEICGGWWALMSGAVSIPFAFLALFWGEAYQKEFFAILAFVALWVFAIRVAWQKNQLMEKLKLNELPCLRIEGIPCDITTSEKHLCQIRVASTKTADNVQVELLSLEDELGEAGKFLRPAFPINLKPEIPGSNTINPGSSQKYNLFRVIKGERFVAYFTQEATKDVAEFFRGKNYRLKLTATARDLPKIEQEFYLNFSYNGSFIRFELTPV